MLESLSIIGELNAPDRIQSTQSNLVIYLLSAKCFVCFVFVCAWRACHLGNLFFAGADKGDLLVAIPILKGNVNTSLSCRILCWGHSAP
jgi:hypothetical protein